MSKIKGDNLVTAVAPFVAVGVMAAAHVSALQVTLTGVCTGVIAAGIIWFRLHRQP